MLLVICVQVPIDNYVDIVKIQVKQVVHKWASYCYTSDVNQCMYLNRQVCMVCVCVDLLQNPD